MFGSKDELGAGELASCRLAAEKPPYTLETPGWLPHVLEEQRALPRGRRRVRSDVVLEVRRLKGRAALAVLAAVLREPRSTCRWAGMVYTGMLNARGGFESDLTIVRLAAR